jgi:hypothetical protein
MKVIIASGKVGCCSWVLRSRTVPKVISQRQHHVSKSLSGIQTISNSGGEITNTNLIVRMFIQLSSPGQGKCSLKHSSSSTYLHTHNDVSRLPLRRDSFGRVEIEFSRNQMRVTALDCSIVIETVR